MPELRCGANPGRSLRAVRQLIALVFVGLALAVFAPSVGAAPGGVIRGVVTNGTTNEPQSGVDVRLLGGTRSDDGSFEQEVETTTTTDDKGRFEFRKLAAGEERVYTLDFRYQDGEFPGGAVSIPANDDVVEISQKVFNTTNDPRAIVIQNDSMFLLMGEEGVNVVHSFRIVNVSREAYIGRGGGGPSGGEPVPTLSFSFPAEARREGVQVADSDLDIPQLLDTETGIGITSAVPPNETNITFAYNLRVNTGQVDLGRRALYPTLNLNVFAEPPFTIDSPNLVDDGTAEIEGTDYARYRSDETITEGNAIQMLATAEGGGDPALVAGALAAAVVLVALVAFALARRRSSAAAAPLAKPTPPAESRDDLLVAIAALDLEHRNGHLTEEDWKAKRAVLKRRLAELRSPEPAS
ncbi:MAG: hypothetical protein ACRDKF_15735 [Actinomycetota bacterium]